MAGYAAPAGAGTQIGPREDITASREFQTEYTNSADNPVIIRADFYTNNENDTGLFGRIQVDGYEIANVQETGSVGQYDRYGVKAIIPSGVTYDIYATTDNSSTTDDMTLDAVKRWALL